MSNSLGEPNAGLFFDTLEGAYLKVLLGMRNGDTTRLRGVFELMMRAPGAIQEPAISLENSNHFARGHKRSLTPTRLLRYPEGMAAKRGAKRAGLGFQKDLRQFLDNWQKANGNPPTEEKADYRAFAVAEFAASHFSVDPWGTERIYNWTQELAKGVLLTGAPGDIKRLAQYFEPLPKPDEDWAVRCVILKALAKSFDEGGSAFLHSRIGKGVSIHKHFETYVQSIAVVGDGTVMRMVDVSRRRSELASNRQTVGKFLVDCLRSNFETNVRVWGSFAKKPFHRPRCRSAGAEAIAVVRGIRREVAEAAPLVFLKEKPFPKDLTSRIEQVLLGAHDETVCSCVSGNAELCPSLKMPKTLWFEKLARATLTAFGVEEPKNYFRA
jgi:hypothetical protein